MSRPTRGRRRQVRSGTHRPILIPGEIPGQLPEWETLSEAYEFSRTTRLPFDELAIDMGLSGMEIAGGGQTASLRAVTITQRAGHLQLVPVIRRGRYLTGTAISLWGPDAAGVPDTCAVDREAVSTSAVGQTEGDRESVLELTRWAVLGASAGLAALRLIEARNVTLETAQVTRQMRRNHHGPLHLPWLVTIEPAGSLREISTDPRPSRLKMRHERRGHYKHYGPGTRIYENNPYDVVYDPVRGPVVKVWCPPTICGPDGAPLRPQVWRLPGYSDLQTEETHRWR